MPLRVYGYAKCDTCRKAWKWLDDHKVEFDRVPIVEAPPSRERLEAAYRASGLPLKRFFNTSGRSYRSGGWSARLKAGVSEKDQLDALAADPMLLKRPLLIGDGVVLVGFKPDTYEVLLG